MSLSDPKTSVHSSKGRFVVTRSETERLLRTRKCSQLSVSPCQSVFLLDIALKLLGVGIGNLFAKMCEGDMGSRPCRGYA